MLSVERWELGVCLGCVGGSLEMLFVLKCEIPWVNYAMPSWHVPPRWTYFIDIFYLVECLCTYFDYQSISFGRLPLCEWHYAVDQVADLELLFPNVRIMPSIPWTPDK